MFSKNQFKKILKSKKREVKITSFFLTQAVIIISAMCVVAAFFWINGKNKSLKSEIRRNQIEYINNQKELIKKETEQAIDYINFSIKKSEEKLHKRTKFRVNQAHKIATNIFEENKGKKSNKEIEKLIVDALRPIRFENKDGYIFIANTKGVEILYPIAPEIEGKNMINLQDELGNYIIKEEINIVLTKGEGYSVSSWKRPDNNESIAQKKLSFVKLFKPFNWYIGTGEFFSEYTKSIKDETIAWLANYRYGKEGYIFINTYDGDALLMNGIPVKEKKNIWELEDPFGAKVIQAERKAVKNPNGDYIYYSWRRLTDSSIIPKMSFVKGVPEWRWMVGSGVYIDDIRSHLSNMEKDLKKDIFYDSIAMFSLVIIIFLLLSLVALYTSKRLKKNISWFIKFFETATSNYELIDKSKITYSEFNTIAEYANNMISELKISEIRKQEEEAHYERLFEKSPEAIAYIGNNNKVIKVNAAFTKLFGYSNEELVKNFLDDYIVPNKLKSKALEYTKEIEQGKEKHIEAIRINKNGKKVHVAIVGTSVTVDDKQLGIYVVYRDITKQKKNEQYLNEAKTKAEESDRLKSSFLMNLSHEIRTPLNAIIGFSNILATKEIDKESQIEYLNILMNSGENLLEIIDNIVDLSKIESSTLVINKTEVNINTTLDELLIDYQEDIVRKDKENIEIYLKKGVPDSNLHIITDPKRIKQVFSNLIDNAIKFTDQGKIEFGYNVDSGIISCYVKDSGIGIQEDDLKFIFDRFRQVDESSTRKYGGTGTGLALCKSLVELLGGKIWAKSEINKGTVFHFTIPYNKAVSQESESEDININTLNWISKKILIAEDDPTNFELLNTYLSKTKADITWVQNGQDAIEKVKNGNHFDIILMDINMPRVNGNEALKIIKSNGVKIPVIAQTAYATSDKLSEIISLGYDDIILKPIDFKLLLKSLVKFIK